MSLPITVVIPTLNCRENLDQHLAAAAGWLPDVAEILAIDSGSTDGTRELLEEKLGGLPHAVIVSTERGLYRAWNLAAERATQPHLYFSTISDMITPAGLSRLHVAMGAHQLDLVISVPRIVDESGRDVPNRQWPVHYLEEFLKSCDGVFLPSPSEKVLLSAIFAPETILGSSASNLYRTAFLRDHPFPEDVGKQGDVYWAIRNLGECRFGLLADRLASFCWDGERNASWGSLHGMMKSMAGDWDSQRPASASALAYAVSRCVIRSRQRQYRMLYRFDSILRIMMRSKALRLLFRVISRDPKYAGVRYGLLEKNENRSERKGAGS